MIRNVDISDKNTAEVYKNAINRDLEKAEQLKEGTKFDGDKTRFDLFPPEALDGIGKILTYGAKKYEDRNWEKGIKWGRVFAAMMRHAWAWWRGEDKDPESGYSHLWHVGCCVMFLIAYEARNMVEFDDRPKGNS